MRGFVVVTRPQPDADDYAAELAAAGYRSLVEPMLQIDDVPFTQPDLTKYDGVIITSANAVELYVRGGGAVLDVTVYCVGKHSAAAARDAGFNRAISVDGIGADLLAYLIAMDGVQDQRFLHLCGRHVAFPIARKLEAAGISADALVIYESVQMDALSAEFLSALRGGEVSAVTFFSRRTAEAFVSLVRTEFSESESEALFSGIKSLSISDAVLECVRVLPWHGSYVSARPDRAGMMMLLTAQI